MKTGKYDWGIQLKSLYTETMEDSLQNKIHRFSQNSHLMDDSPAMGNRHGQYVVNHIIIAYINRGTMG